jgi:hypothetical protein
MRPSQPDDTGSPSPEGSPQPHGKPLPPAVAYALDCLEHMTTPGQVRRHLVAVGYSPREAAEAVRLALDHREAERPSAWSPEDAPARRCLSLGFLLLVFGIIAGCAKTYLQARLPAAVPNLLNLLAWAGILAGLVLFCLGLAQMRFRRRE